MAFRIDSGLHNHGMAFRIDSGLHNHGMAFMKDSGLQNTSNRIPYILNIIYICLYIPKYNNKKDPSLFFGSYSMDSDNSCGKFDLIAARSRLEGSQPLKYIKKTPDQPHQRPLCYKYKALLLKTYVTNPVKFHAQGFD